MFRENYGFAYIAPNYFVTCGSSGVYKSTDNGNNWFAVNNGLPANAYNLFASGNNLFCNLSYPGGVYLSTNQGNNWQNAGNGLPYFTSVEKFLQIGGTIYLLNSGPLQDTGGVFSSTNNGTNWIRTNHNGLPIISNAGIGGITNKSSILYATYYHNVYKSSNGGNDWQNISNNLPDTTNREITNDGANIYVSTGLGLFKTTNDGSSWFSINSGLENRSIFEILSFNTDLFVATRWNGVYKSTNGGGNWFQFHNGILNSYARQLVSLNNSLITGSNNDNGIFISSNNGNNWSAANNGFPQLPYVKCLYVNGQDVYAGVSINLFVNHQVWKSTNTGGSWFNSSTGLPNSSINDFTSNANGIYCATYTGVYKTTNNGNSWAISGLASSSSYITSSGNNLIASVNDTDIYISTNSGTTWSEITSGLPLRFTYIYAIKSSGNKVFAGIYASTNGGVYFSSNNGLNWQYRNNGIATNTIINTFIFYNNYVIAAGRKIYISTDDGINWQDVSSNLTVEYGARALAIVGSNIFVGTNLSVWRRPLSEIIGIQTISTEIPKVYTLKQNYPNPFNPTTQIEFSIPQNNEFVKLIVFDVTGKEISTLVNQQLNTGSYRVDFNGEYLASGVYFYKLEAGDYIETKKMILLK